MGIPGLRPSFEVRAKVRVGEKGKTAGGKEYPKSTDHFVCDDTEFQSLYEKPKELKVVLPFEDAADNFSTGLEHWRGKTLACYTKGEQRQGQSVAYRRTDVKSSGTPPMAPLDTFTVIGEPMGNSRVPVACPARDCADMVSGACKPMGRLQFFIVGLDRTKGVFQLDTKSWNTVEKIEAFLSIIGDPRGRELSLHVEMWSKGTSKFPVVHLEGTPVQVDTPADVELADRLVMLHKALAGDDEAALKQNLAYCLDLTTPTWRNNSELIAKLKSVGASAAAKSLLERCGL